MTIALWIALAVVAAASWLAHRSKNKKILAFADRLDAVEGKIESALLVPQESSQVAPPTTTATATPVAPASVMSVIKGAGASGGAAVLAIVVGVSTLALLAVLFVGAMSGCGPTPSSVVADGEHILFDCTTTARASFVAALKPAAASVIDKAQNPDGTIDQTALDAWFSRQNLLSEAGIALSCAGIEAFADFMAAIGAPAPPAPATPSIARTATPAAISARAATFAQLRAKFGGAQFKTPSGTY